MVSTHIVQEGGGVTVIHGGAVHQIPADHPKRDQIVALVNSGDYDNAVSLIDLRAEVKRFIDSASGFSIERGRIVYDGYSFSDAVTEKVFRMVDRGNPAGPLLAFLRKLRSNPSATAREQLLEFCEANDFAITRDGDLLAYRSIRDDWTDHHTGTFDNSVGEEVTMDRGEVDDNRHNTCSRGLHFGALHYMAQMYGFTVNEDTGRYSGGHGRLVAVTVNPRDVVSIPPDYRSSKGRCCRFKVVAELTDHPALPDNEVFDADDLSRSDVQPEPVDDAPPTNPWGPF